MGSRNRRPHDGHRDPQGSRNKYSYDPDTGAFDLGWVLPPGLSFPYDFDFIPSTIAEDGDALDVLVLLDVPVAVGRVVAGRVIGAIQAKQRAPGGQVDPQRSPARRRQACPPPPARQNR
jgi:hypothetical protein